MYKGRLTVTARGALIKLLDRGSFFEVAGVKAFEHPSLQFHFFGFSKH
jgi:hypothetical protein